jgi:hypothetical protein
LLFLVGCQTESSTDKSFDVVCPPGWSADAFSDGDCRASESTVAETRSRLTTGITGFVRVTTGACSNCVHCSCNTRLVDNQEVQAFVAADADSSDGCSRDGLPALPLARTSTDLNGVYSFKLAPGKYVVVSDDPALDGNRRCTAFRDVVVGSDVAITPLVFDHGAY